MKNVVPNLLRPAAMAAAFLLLSGCVAPVDIGAVIKSAWSYPPIPSPVKFDATVSLSATHKVTPGMREEYRTWAFTDEMFDSYSNAFSQVVAGDLTNSGLFTRFASPGEEADYILKVEIEETHPADYQLLITYDLSEARNGHQLNRRTLYLSMGKEPKDLNYKDRLPRAMAQVRESIIADIQGQLHKQQDAVARAESETLQQEPLLELLVSSDTTVSSALARNRAIITAKNRDLPALLKNKETAGLTDLVTRFEQTILDLNHESEVAKDKAQQAATSNGDPQQLDKWRGLSICFRERIELMKPILAALKEEIANRGR